jgi:hypothetical protein
MAEMRVVPRPMCGRVAGQKAIRRAGSYIKVGSSNFWTSTRTSHSDILKAIKSNKKLGRTFNCRPPNPCTHPEHNVEA